MGAVQQTWLHTLGNLTLTGYNSEYSDRPFSEKRDMTGGFKESPLRLNAGLGQLERWDEEAIKSGRAGSQPRRWSLGSPKLPQTYWTHIRPRPQPLATQLRITYICSPAPCTRCSKPSARRYSRSILRHRGVPEALCCLQGGDQLRGRCSAGQTAPALPKYGVPRDGRPTRHLQGRLTRGALGQRRC